MPLNPTKHRKQTTQFVSPGKPSLLGLRKINLSVLNYGLSILYFTRKTKLFSTKTELYYFEVQFKKIEPLRLPFS